MKKLVIALLCGLLPVNFLTVYANPELKISLHKTSDGIELGVLGNTKQGHAAPVLIILATTIQGTLGSEYYRHCGNQLLGNGYVCVSIDLPCHGDQRIGDEPEGLPGWSHKVSQGVNFVAEFNRRLSSALDYLIEERIADPERIAICGTSRGGFLALHGAINDKRIKCVAAFSPVTDLFVLHEFKSNPKKKLIKEINLLNYINQLAYRKVWIVIGDQDKRVGTDHAVKLAREVSNLSNNLQTTGKVYLHVMSEPRGHTVPDGADKMAAKWIVKELGRGV